jgi:hypothetical protein
MELAFDYLSIIFILKYHNSQNTFTFKYIKSYYKINNHFEMFENILGYFNLK